MTLRERIVYLNTMSATIATQHRELVALQERLEELRRRCAAQASVQKRSEMSKMEAAIQRHLADEKVGQLFARLNLVP